MSTASRLIFLIVALASGAAAGPATVEPFPRPAAAGEPPAADAAELFARHCAVCHRANELARNLQQAPDREAAKAVMRAWLMTHGRTDAAGDAVIAGWLAGGGRP
jgi:mono/diheme cytochrome c family protein